MTDNSEVRVLFVDDEQFVLDAIRRTVRKTFDATFAAGGQQALNLLDGDEEPFAVICTDMRMPSVDGLAVLRAFRDRAPNTTRVLLTGQADLDSATAAVNEGNIFRFLTKPTNSDQLKRALDDAVELFQLHAAERELLDKTLTGSVQALVETLSLANPVAFARSSRITAFVKRVIPYLEIENQWEVEVATMLSQVGAVTLPPELSDRLNRGVPLNREEITMVNELPELADQLLSIIPRLGTVRHIIKSQLHWESETAPVATKLLVLAREFDTLTERRLAPDVVEGILSEHAEQYGQPVMQAFLAMTAAQPSEARILFLPPRELCTGMVLASDIKTRDALLLVGRGQVLSAALLVRISNFGSTVGLEEELVAVFETVG